MNKFVCIHGHFYQPPRENPWSGVIEKQETASPYSDWNARITTECYAPNAVAEILDHNNQVRKIVNNYSKINFNFGPTLLAWMKKNASLTYKVILEADKESIKRFAGHGAAIAQAYNHMILPLANKQDKITQVVWGIEDFKYRFNRMPEGMWLPETGVDIKTLEVLALHNLRFTILAPSQAMKIRELDGGKWKKVKDHDVNTQSPYLCQLPSGREIVIFFYDGHIAHEVAFGDLLKNGENFAHRLVGSIKDDVTKPTLAHIATDGETYGHHHRFGDKALAYLLDFIEEHKLAHITVYGEFLELCPPTYEVKIHEDTSWSCSHGVERWRSDCGCAFDKDEKKNQEWRTYLRDALDWLRDELIEIYENNMRNLFKDPWDIRNEYIDLILHGFDEASINRLKEKAVKELSGDDMTKVLRLLEMQHCAMLMYTSCGWFFDDISGLETRQILQYAAKAIQLAKTVSGKNLENQFLQRLKYAKSNVAKMKNGKVVYEVYVKPLEREI